jgi:hypothetical protein
MSSGVCFVHQEPVSWIIIGSHINFRQIASDGELLPSYSANAGLEGKENGSVSISMGYKHHHIEVSNPIRLGTV